MLDTAVSELPHTSGLTKKRMRLLGLSTYGDLLKYAPNRYEDYSRIVPLAKITLFLDQKITVTGTVLSIIPVRTRSRLSLQKVVVTDISGKITISFFNQPYLLTQIKKGKRYAFSGTVKQFGSTYTIQPETFEEIGEQYTMGVQTGRILPVYSEAKGLSSRLLREKIAGILPLVDTAEESLPREVVDANGLLPLPETLSALHRPLTLDKLHEARYRLGFEELFLLQLSTALIKKEWQKTSVTNKLRLTPSIKKKLEEFINTLPFELTLDQKKAIDAILHDIGETIPMNRFLQGDVGSGKTVVAVLAAYATCLAGKKTLYMAPTELLALQHAETFKKFLSPLGVTIGIQTGSKKEIKKLPQGDIFIGTHALLNGSFTESIGLVIIDEQHRFGVKQRAILKSKGESPHLLTMTATPIPRTVALTAFGELDMSVIQTLPTGRKPIKTYVVTPQKRQDGYEWIKKQMKATGVQVFVICPLVDESTSETMTSIKAATQEYQSLQKEFKDFSVGLLHGKMKPSEKEIVLNDFRDKKIHLLVSTSVVEVGIDIPNAGIMIIEGAERFGLSQLHQLRGRIGRGTNQAHCLLFASPGAVPARLHHFASTTKGMELAEYDLKERGPGNIFGIEQHGFMDIKFASLTDSVLIEKTQRAVSHFLSLHSIEDFPYLKRKIEMFQIDKIAKD